MPVQNIHAHSFAKTALLSSYQMPTVIQPIDVIRLLNREKISFVLVGLHGLAGWMDEPRGTEDVDVIVAAKHHKRAVQLLQKAFPHLLATDGVVVTRLRDPETDKVVIDVMKPVQQPHREAFKYTRTVNIGRQHYRIPTLEMALAMKFAPMTSPNRAYEDKLQDAHDFVLIVKKNTQIDLEILRNLGDLIYPQGGDELLEMVRKIRAGERLGF